MSYVSPHSAFVFEGYAYGASSSVAEFHYSFDGKRHFHERLHFQEPVAGYDKLVFEKALFLAYMLGGISYYKSFPTLRIDTHKFSLSKEQADFFTNIYLHGLSQYIFENQLSPSDIGAFQPDVSAVQAASPYAGKGTLVLQSGGKDSLLLAELLSQKHTDFVPWYMSSGKDHPQVIETVGPKPLRHMRREIDTPALQLAQKDGSLNGHVPVTFMTLSYALLDALLHSENTVLAAIGREGEEPHAYIQDFPVMHQWSKTWMAEQQFARYIESSISPDIRIGSPLRGYSELKIAELFSRHAWKKYGHLFSSCNIGNYQQGQDNTILTWCGHCPKCANSFLLFAPFIDPEELESIFGGNLFAEPRQLDSFKGLLGIENVMKPFECVGEIAELRTAYHMARRAFPGADYGLPFTVPAGSYDYESIGASQSWAQEMLQ